MAIQKENLLKYSLEVHEVEYHNTYLATQIDNGLSYTKKYLIDPDKRRFKITLRITAFVLKFVKKNLREDYLKT